MTSTPTDLLDAAIAAGQVTDVPDRGMPRPLDPENRPIPFAVHLSASGLPEWARVSTKVTMLCTLGSRCHMCGEHVEDDDAWAFHDGMGRVVDGWIMHHRCARLAQSHCPHLRGGEDIYLAPARQRAQQLRDAAHRKLDR